MHYYSDKYKEWTVYVSRFNNGQFSDPIEVYYEAFDIPRTQLSNAYQRFTRNIDNVRDLVKSPDSSHVAFVNVIRAADYRKDDIVSVAVWNADMTLKWKAVFDFKFGDKDFDVKEAVVSNDGQVYFLASVDRRLDNRGKPISHDQKGLPKYVFNMYKVSEEEILENKVDLGRGKGIVDAGLFVENEDTGEVLLGGFYTTDNPKTKVEGVFFVSGTQELKMGDYKVHKFGQRYMAGLASTRAIKKKKGLSYNYDIKNLLFFDNETMGFVAENNFISRSNNNISPYNRSFTGVNNRFNERIDYQTNEIVIPRFDMAGELINIEKIDKSFRSEQRDQTSYALATANNKTYLIFNDKKSGHEKKSIRKKGNRFTDLVVLDASGKIEFNDTIFTNKESDLPFVTSLVDYSDKYIIVGASFGSKFTFGRIDLR